MEVNVKVGTSLYNLSTGSSISNEFLIYDKDDLSIEKVTKTDLVKYLKVKTVEGVELRGSNLATYPCSIEGVFVGRGCFAELNGYMAKYYINDKMYQYFMDVCTLKVTKEKECRVIVNKRDGSYEILLKKVYSAKGCVNFVPTETGLLFVCSGKVVCKLGIGDDWLEVYSTRKRIMEELLG